MLEISRLSKRRPGDAERWLFRGLELSIAAGECVAVIGESGAGKSTLLNCLAGLEPVEEGEIHLGDAALAGLGDDAYARIRRERFGFVFQAFHILPHLTLAQNVALPLWLLQMPTAQAEREALAMLERVGLRNRADDWPAGLSGGEQQRVAIARALVHKPQLVLADEPTGNLDPARADDILDLLLTRIRDSDAAGILVTHSHRAAARCDRTLRLSEDGLLPAEGG